MQGSADETVGREFDIDRLQEARDKTLAVIEEVAALVRPGMQEREARQALAEIQARAGAPKSWHPPQIRFGQNTLLPFGKKGADEISLSENDIFFVDIGPIFLGHEGDVGRSFTVGAHPEMRRCCEDIEEIWGEVRAHWRDGATGPALYDYARARAQARGWQLALEGANGHRIADFPHAARNRGSIEGFSDRPAPNRWILEIQLRHPTEPFGAFYEDLLN